MGGKSKKEPRAKDNARPSSSSHCAGLLGSSVPVFANFSSIKESVFGSDKEPSSKVDTQLHLLLKKMMKKYSVTKLKALQEFTWLCENSDVETVKSILPFWPRLYCALAMDVEHRVREAAHVAHSAIAEKVKKSLAPYLKQLAGPWFISQYDTYPPAASAATSAFQRAFPLSKENKAILFCQEEILNYIYENLVTHTPQTLSNPKITNEEEMDAKYQRIVLASLQGYSLYLQKLTSDQIMEAMENNKKIVLSPKFWEYSKNKNPVVRCSFFNVINALCQNGKFLLLSEMKRMTTAIFTNLDDPDAVVMTSVWDAALNALVCFEDIWTHINFEKQVFPKLNAVIRKGGRNAITIFPSVLPLLSKIPPDLMKDKLGFYGSILQSIRCVMEGPTVINPSTSDGKTIAMTFMECLKYIISQNNSDESLCNSLVRNYLIPSLDVFLSSSKSTNSSVTIAFFTETSKALRNWYSCIASTVESYRSILNQFWNSLLNIYEKNLDSESSFTVLEDILNNQLTLLEILQNPNKHYGKSMRKLRFVQDSSNNTEISETMTEILPADNDPHFHNELLKFVKSISGTYLKNSFKNQEGLFIPILNQIVNIFDSKIIFEEFRMVLNESTLHSLFHNVFSKWLERDCLKRGELVYLSFSLLQHLERIEKELILRKFFESWQISDLQYDICRLLIHYYEDDSVKSWILSDTFSNYFLELTKNFVDSDSGCDKSKDIITEFLKEDDRNGEFILNSKTISLVMEIVSNRISKLSQTIHVIELAQSLVVKVAGKAQEYLNAYEQLIISLFKLSCYHEEDENLMATLGFGLKKAFAKNGNNFVKKLADAVKEIIFNEDITLNIENVICKINYFIELSIETNLKKGSCSNGEIERAVGIISHFVNVPAMITDCRDKIKNCCFIGYQSVGHFDLKFIDLMEKKTGFNSSEETSDNILNKISSHFNANVTDGNISDEYFKEVLIYSQIYKSVNMNMSQKYGKEFTPEMMVNFAKYIIFVGRMLNLLFSAHPRTYKSSILLEDWNPYCTDDKQIKDFKDKNPVSDVLPIELTKEEFYQLKLELKNVIEQFNSSDYQDKINVFPICGEIFDLFYSIGLLVTFSDYCAGTIYFTIMQKYINETVTIGKELLLNANLHENLFFYRCCKYFVSNTADWHILKSALQDLFHRNFSYVQPVLCPGWVSDFIESEISSPIIGNNMLLRLSYILQDKTIYDIKEDEWNKIFILLHKFIENSTITSLTSENDVTALSLVSRITLQLFELFSQSHSRSPEEKLCPEACLAWNEVVRKELEKGFLNLWQTLAKKWHDKPVSLDILIAIQNISEIVMQSKSSIESPRVEILETYIRCMQSSHVVFQITSFGLLIRLVPELVRIDTKTYCKRLSKLTEEMKKGSVKTSKCNWICQQLEETISSIQGIVEIMLLDFVIGDSCSMKPFTDSFNYTFSYLLLWYFLLEMCGEADSSLRFQYGLWLKNNGYTNSVLESIFKLMPQSVISGSVYKKNNQKLFENYSFPSGREPVNSERIENIACFVYRKLLETLPNIIREWWVQSENKISNLVERVTSFYVSPILINNEMKNVQQDGDDCFENLVIKTRPNSREIIATYTIDEVKMDLILTLPQNYPLGTIKVESSKMVINSWSRRNCLFNISKYLIHQNGTIWESLIMWKNNLDEKFKGVEECYICASILLGSTFETPRTPCRMCKKKFHSHCLYKWFSTSNNSSCPICRNLF